jgi:hypothetical protein
VIDRESKSFRHDANDGVGIVADAKGLANRGRIVPEQPRPHRMTEDRDRAGAGADVVIGEQASMSRRRASQLES